MLNMLKDPAKRAEWVYGQPMAACPKCGSYNMKPQMPIAMETTGDSAPACGQVGASHKGRRPAAARPGLLRLLGLLSQGAGSGLHRAHQRGMPR